MNWVAVGLRTAGIVVFTVLLHDRLAHEWAWPCTKFSLDLKDASESAAVTMFGREFQGVGAEH